MTEDKDRQPETTGDSAKRKLEDPAMSILLAKQKAQEIAARLVTNAESKRPRVDDESFQPNPVYTAPAYPGSPVNMFDSPDGWTSEPKPCHECSKEHPGYSYCPYKHCDICYKEHYFTDCPYLFSIPRGVAFSPKYEIVCRCGGQFDEDKWACTYCGCTVAKITAKCCILCNTIKQHAPYECPVDKVAAEQCKLAREEKRSIGPTRTPCLMKPSYDYVPISPKPLDRTTPSPRFLNMPTSPNSSSHVPSPRHEYSTRQPDNVSVFTAQTGHSYGSGTSKKIDIPNGKVGVIIGKQGETIRQLQLQSGAKIQITRDSEADPNSLTRNVELTGTFEQISRAEELINDVIAEADAGGSAPSTNQGYNSMQPGGEQFVMKVPNNKVALIIGKGGETIRNMQTKSGARIQIVPLHLPPGDMSTERSVYINGGTEQIEAAKELVNEVISGKRLLNASGTNSYMQQPSYPPSGNWAPPGQPPIQQPQPHYGYTQPGGYGTPPAAASYYGNYPAQVGGWDQSNQVPPQPPQDSSGYNYYGQQPPMGSAPPNPGYYNQTSQGYAKQPPTYYQGYGQQPPSYDQSYAQQPPSYDQTYAQQPPNYGQAPASDQQQYATSGYGPPAVSSSADGSSSTQTTQPSSAYAPPYGQPMDNPQSGFWSHPSSTGQPHGQAGYYQHGYGGQPAEDASTASQPASYGQGGYAQPDPSANGESQHPPSEQSQSQPPTNGYADQSSASEAERTGNRHAEGDGSDPLTEPVGSQN